MKIILRKTKIVNGTETAINEFVSMVGFYDIPTNDVFCGGAISKKKNSNIF